MSAKVRLKEEIEFTECDSMSQIMRIEVNLPENHWAGIVTRNNPQSILQIIETMPLSRGRGTAQIICDKDIMAALSSTKGVESLQILAEDRATVTIASGGGGFIKSMRNVGVVPRTPFDVIDGWADWTIQCSSDQAKQLVQEIQAEELQMKLKSTRSSEEKLLTTRQKQVFELAKRKGYWNSPREISLTNLSEILEISKSTLSVMLHSIESKIIEQYYNEIMS